MTRSLIGLLLAATCALAEPQTVRLGWGHQWDGKYTQVGCNMYRNTPKGADPLEGDDVWYLDLELRPGKRLLVAAQLKRKPPRAFFDLDFDSQFDDETPFELTGRGRRVECVFDLAWRDTPEAEPHAIPFEMVFDRETSRGIVWVKFRAHRQAQVVLGGRLRWVAASSEDGNLLIDDDETDLIYVDVDGDGRITPGEESHDRVRAGQPFRIGKQGYVVGIDASAPATLRIESAPNAPPPDPRPWPAPQRRYRRRARSYTARQPLKELVALYQKNRKVRRRGSSIGSPGSIQLRYMGSIGSVGSVKFLVTVIRKEKDADLRETALLALGDSANRPHAKIVMSAVRASKKPYSTTALLEALDIMQAAARQEFFLLMLDTTRDDAVRALCADMLCAGGGQHKLAKRFGSLRQPAANYHAYRAITRSSKVPPTNGQLNRALMGKDARLRMTGLADVAWLGRRATQPDILALASEEVKRKRVTPNLVRVMVETLGPVAGAEEIPVLFGALPVATRATRERLVDLLVAVRNDAAEAAIRAQASHRDPNVRCAAVRVLAQIPGTENVEVLTTRLAKEQVPEVLIPLITAAGKGKLQATAPKLLHLLQREKKNIELREAAWIALARIGFVSKAIESYFERAARASDWRDRLDMTDAVARYGNASTLPFLARRLADEQWRVHIAGAQGLGRIRTREAIAPLIARLETETDRRTRRAIADALFRITGQSLYDIHKLWVKWWANEGDAFVVPAVIPVKKKSKGGRRTVSSFYGVPVESERVVFVIDQSGSMGGTSSSETELDKAVQQTLKVIAGMRNGAMVEVIFFESRIHPWAKKLVKLDAAKRTRLKKHLLAQSPTGGTNLYDGLEMALKIKDVDTIYLLSDGAPGSGKFVLEEDIVREIGKLNKRLRIQIHGISIGRESSLLKKLSEQSGGTYARR